MTTGEKIKELRTQKGMTQGELAALLGVKVPAIYKYENGLITNLKRSTVEKLSAIFDVDPIYLMGWDLDGDLEDCRQRLAILQDELAALPDTEYGDGQRETVKAEIEETEQLIRRLEAKIEKPAAQGDGLKDRLSRLDPDLLKLLADFVALAQDSPETAKRHLSFAVQELQSSQQDQ